MYIIISRTAMYMMYIDDFWNVSNYAIPVKRNSCLNKNSIHLPIACSLEKKWTRNSHNNIMYIDGFYPWQRISNVWIICEKKIRNDILPKYLFSCNIWCVTYMYYLYESFWQFESYEHVHVFWYCFTVCKYASTALES